MRQNLRLFLLVLCFLHLVSCSTGANPSPSANASPAPTPSSEDPLDLLFSRIWRVSDSAHTPAPDSVYIFLRNGTLLETSCVETYRVALWSIDKAQPGVLRVTEDQQPVFSATIGESTANTIHLHQTLLRSKETRDLTLTSIDNEFVCPDLHK